MNYAQNSATGLTESDRSAVEMLYRAFNEKNPDLLDRAVAPDWDDQPLAPFQEPGREGMKPMIRAFVAAFPDMKITIQEMMGSDGRAAVRAQITGTHLGEWFGVAPTQKSFAIAIHEFHYIKNGLVTHTWHLEDWFGWLHQVGAWPKAPEPHSQPRAVLRSGEKK
jgi:predicted ester cyclase